MIDISIELFVSILLNDKMLFRLQSQHSVIKSYFWYTYLCVFTIFYFDWTTHSGSMCQRMYFSQRFRQKKKLHNNNKNMREIRVEVTHTRSQSYIRIYKLLNVAYGRQSKKKRDDNFNGNTSKHTNRP